MMEKLTIYWNTKLLGRYPGYLERIRKRFGITKGMTDTTFEPDATCTRGQIVTFLYRIKESPAPKSTETPFTDVNPKAFYAKAVAWAVEEGVTKGMTDTTFAPNDTCTRGQIVTFLYRAMGGK